MKFEENNKAIYLQIADRLCDAIVNGTYKEGERMPSVRDIAADAEVNANTVMRSMEKLTADGIIFNKRGIGFFVSVGAVMKIVGQRADRLLEKDLSALFNVMMHLNISPDALKEEYEKYLREHAPKE